MHPLSKRSCQTIAFLLILPFVFSTQVTAQLTTPPRDTEVTGKDKSRLIRSKNEFGIWTGFSPFSFRVEGTSKDRQLFLFNLQYARVLLATQPITLRYTAELVPVALQRQPTQFYVFTNTSFINPAATVYGAGANPVGFQGNFGSKRVQPFVNGTVGFLYFTQPVPIIGSSQFNYAVTIGVGLQIFQHLGRAYFVGWKYHHLSNDYQATYNPGIDSSVFYVGMSLTRITRRSGTSSRSH